MQLRTVSLADKYTLDGESVFVNGSQAIVRLVLEQALKDRAAGHDTAGFISGYRGSPVHNIDNELWRAAQLLKDNNVRFSPGINEDLAATAVWGTQQIHALGDARVDGVFGMWYGKGPGFDRSIDAIRHAHLTGTSRHGGVLAVVGDDHSLSSTDTLAAHEQAFADLMMPVLFPATIQDLVDFGLFGWELSRACGLWVAMKVLSDTIDSTGQLVVDRASHSSLEVADLAVPPEGLYYQLPDTAIAQEERLRRYKIPNVVALARAYHVNRQVTQPSSPRCGILATGIAYNHVMQGLHDLGIDEGKAAELGLQIQKVAMPYPVDEVGYRAFADGLERVLVVEDRLDFTARNLRAAVGVLPDGRRPEIINVWDHPVSDLISEKLTLSDRFAILLVESFEPIRSLESVIGRVDLIREQHKTLNRSRAVGVRRTPFFCSGCPHNSSTKVPEGSRAYGGVGCHYLATIMDRSNVTHTHMGGEGGTWIGQAPFVSTQHVFQNLGEGTYFHSGSLAIRAAIAAKVTITFKILFNDAVAMTGGQPVDGELTPQVISHQVRAEGVERIFVVTDEPDKYDSARSFASGTTVHARSDLEDVQKTCTELSRVSVIIYDQTCAAELRRRRKRGTAPDRDRRLFINPRVCEGCGDCNAASNCLSVLPLETAYGRKRTIDQSSCNKDFACADGFCPSFVSVVGAEPRKPSEQSLPTLIHKDIPAPTSKPSLGSAAFGILLTGVGGTGVVTIGALLAMAAHLEGKATNVIDQLGMAQKGGAVTSHILIAEEPEDIKGRRLAAGGANLILGFDTVVLTTDEVLSLIDPAKTNVIVNTAQQITGDFLRNPDLRFPTSAIDRRLREFASDEHVETVDATDLATRLLGDAVAANMFVIGFAYQNGLLPLSEAAIKRAIELNGVAVALNQDAFDWGRLAAFDMEAIEGALATSDHETSKIEVREMEDLELEKLYYGDLVFYQNEAYADRFQALVKRVRTAEQTVVPGSSSLVREVIVSAHKLMAYKDEYEVARLYTDGTFERAVGQSFQGQIKLRFHMAPPALGWPAKGTRPPRKVTFGSWMLGALRILAKFKFLRGTLLDVFAYSAERKRERLLIAEFEQRVDELLSELSAENHALAVDIARLPQRIRGFGHVKERSIREFEASLDELLSSWPHGVGRPESSPSPQVHRAEFTAAE